MNVNIYDAKMKSLCGSLKVAVIYSIISKFSIINVHLDNFSIAQTIERIPNRSSQNIFKKFQNIVKN